MNYSLAIEEVKELPLVEKIRLLGFKRINDHFIELRRLHDYHEPSIYFLVTDRIIDSRLFEIKTKPFPRKRTHYYKERKTITLEPWTLGRALEFPLESNNDIDVEFFPTIRGYRDIKKYLDNLKNVDYIPEFPEERYPRLIDLKDLSEKVIILGYHNPFDELTLG